MFVGMSFSCFFCKTILYIGSSYDWWWLLQWENSNRTSVFFLYLLTYTNLKLWSWYSNYSEDILCDIFVLLLDLQFLLSRYILAQEHGDIINVHDWFQSFKAILVNPSIKARSKSKHSSTPKKKKNTEHSDSYSAAAIQYPLSLLIVFLSLCHSYVVNVHL